MPTISRNIARLSRGRVSDCSCRMLRSRRDAPWGTVSGRRSPVARDGGWAGRQDAQGERHVSTRREQHRFAPRPGDRCRRRGARRATRSRHRAVSSRCRPRAGGPSSTTAPACVLHIAVTLFGASSEQLDQSVLPPLTVHAGDNAEASLAVGSRTSYVSLALGLDHTCRALTVSGGGTTCWGSNRVNQLGRAPTPDFLQISAGLSYTCGLTRAGEAWCWGDNAAGQLGDNLAPSRAAATLVKSPVVFTQLATGTDFACGLSTAGAAYCWGENAWATLGDGTKSRHSTPAPVKGGLTFRRLMTGGHFACGLTNGPVYCWGAIGLTIPIRRTGGARASDAGRKRVGGPGIAHGRVHARVRCYSGWRCALRRNERQRTTRRRHDDRSNRTGSGDWRIAIHHVDSGQQFHVWHRDGRLRVLLGGKRIWSARDDGHAQWTFDAGRVCLERLPSRRSWRGRITSADRSTMAERIAGGGTRAVNLATVRRRIDPRRRS